MIAVVSSCELIMLHQLIQATHPQWHDLLYNALCELSPDYVLELLNDPHWLPGLPLLFAAFQQPLSATRFILLGESPYPRQESANGYAFWDANVHQLWSKTGLSKEVNRATSLRNMIKMLLHAQGDLSDDYSQQAIARLDKTAYVQTANQLFTVFIKKGFLLLNASLVYRSGQVVYHACQWRGFVTCLLTQLAAKKPDIQLILFGKIAAKIPNIADFKTLKAEHPYNLSFITNPQVVDFFKPLELILR